MPRKRCALRLSQLGCAAFALVFFAVAPSVQAMRGLTLGFSADPALTGPSAPADTPWINRAVTEGARIVRVNVVWSQIAPAQRPPGFVADDPASPGYDWSPIDAPVRALAAHGLRVLLTIYDAPNWAEGPGRDRGAPAGSWKPDPTQLALFARAAALRYSGRFPDPHQPGAALPQVQYWQAWNEPNLVYYIAPQWERTSTGIAPASPEIYRGMLNAFYGAVKGVNPSNFVVTAGTAPYGDPPGGIRMRPIAFYRALFCLRRGLRPTSCPDPVHFDAVDHHPYSGDPNSHAYWGDDVAIADMYKIASVLRAAEHFDRVLPSGFKPIWVTELSWNTAPPDPQGIPVGEDARWLERALYLLWRQGVSTVMPLQIADGPPVAQYSYTYDWGGLFYHGGRPKPAAIAFRFPFVIHRIGRATLSVWGRSPIAGRLLIERLQGRTWSLVSRLTVGWRQVFTTKLGFRGSGTLRARVGGQTSLSWTQRG